MRRRLMHREGGREDEFFQKFKSAICDIKELSLILKNMSLEQQQQQQLQSHQQLPPQLQPQQLQPEQHLPQQQTQQLDFDDFPEDLASLL